MSIQVSVDGVGRLACAYRASGHIQRNQLGGGVRRVGGGLVGGGGEDRPVSDLTPWARARRAAREAAHPLPVVEVPLAAAVGAVLAHPLVSSTPLPPFDSAGMDGWAVAGPGPWVVVGELLAGDTLDRLADGAAVGIATGAALPTGADAVLRR